MSINPAYVTTSLAMDKLAEANIGVFMAAVEHAHGRYELEAGDIAVLDSLDLTQHGVMHDVTREAIRSLYPDKEDA